MKGGPAEAVYDSLCCLFPFALLTINVIVNRSYGPMLIGLLFNILLYGTMLVQVYIYFTTYKKCVIRGMPLASSGAENDNRDRTWLKALVGPAASVLVARITRAIR
jgi:hypothetical protein